MKIMREEHTIDWDILKVSIFLPGDPTISTHFEKVWRRTNAVGMCGAYTSTACTVSEVFLIENRRVDLPIHFDVNVFQPLFCLYALGSTLLDVVIGSFPHVVEFDNALEETKQRWFLVLWSRKESNASKKHSNKWCRQNRSLQTYA